MSELTHYRKGSEVAMVDVTAKPATTRTAIAHCFVRMTAATLRAIRRLETPKGNPLEVARIAGLAAAKRTPERIPLCHPIPLSHIDVTTRLCKTEIAIHSCVAALDPHDW